MMVFLSIRYKLQHEHTPTLKVEIENTRSKCYDCMRPSSACMCEHLNPIKTQTRFSILMHPKEYKKERIGTGRMTQLQLENSEIIVGVDFTNNQRVNEILSQESNCPLLLYPGKESFNLSVRTSIETSSFMGDNPHIILIDGTWSCAKKMLRLSNNLQELRRVSFDNSITSKFVIKQQPNSLCLSTIESVYTVLNILKEHGLEDCDTNGFLKPFEKMIEYQIECFLNPNNKHYRGSVNKEITTKNMYQPETKRSIIFEQES